MTDSANYEAMFSGAMGKEYQMLALICPLAIKMSQAVARAVADYGQQGQRNLVVVELGGGTGITTAAIFAETKNLMITSVDNEPTMQEQARQNLQPYHEGGQLIFSGDDALSALQKMPDNSVDIIASAYTVHNFLASYRIQVIHEIFRVLKSGGQFVNGDRYALDAISAHTLLVQKEISGYFKVFVAQNRLDLLEQWLTHLFNDETENHIMRESVALAQLKQAGFAEISLTQREEVNALVIAVKP